MQKPKTHGLSGRQRVVMNYLKRFPDADFCRVAADVGLRATMSGLRWFRRLQRKMVRLGHAAAVHPDRVMSYGRHVGQKYRDVPTRYLIWVAKNAFSKSDGTSRATRDEFAIEELERRGVDTKTFRARIWGV